jgi:hypothetical protein
MSDLSRRSFLKILGLTSVAATVAPRAIGGLFNAIAPNTVPEIVVDGEMIQVTAIVGNLVTVTRGYGRTVPKGSGTSIAIDPASAAMLDYGYVLLETTAADVWEVVGRPTYQNCDLGMDKDREWRCGYCEAINRDRDFQCATCGAPKRLLTNLTL